MLEPAQDWWACRGDEQGETPLTADTFFNLLRLDAITIE